MNVVEVRGEIDSPPSIVWALLGDFGGVTSWNPFVQSAEISGEGPGMTRTITAHGGACILERLESIEPRERHLRYSVQLESGTQSSADIRLEEGTSGRTIVVWQSIRENELPQEQKDTIAATLRSRIDALAQTIAARQTD